MRTTDRLSFRVVIAEPNVAERTITVHPRYEGLKIKWSRASGKMYYAEDISGTVKFWGADYNALDECALRTKFTLIIYNLGEEKGRIEFRKTDCKWDADHTVCEIDVEVYDEYKKIQDKADEEYNLVKLELQKKNMSMYIYPMRQVYFLNDTSVFLTRQEPLCTTISPTNTDASYGDLADMHFNVPTNPTNGNANVMGLVYINTTTSSSYNVYKGWYYTYRHYFVDTGEWFGNDKIYEAWMYKGGLTTAAHKIRIECHVGNASGATRYKLEFYDGSTLVASTGIGSFSPTELDNSGWDVTPSVFTHTTSVGFWLDDATLAFSGSSRFYLPMSRIMTASSPLILSNLTSDDLTAENNRNWKAALTLTNPQNLDVSFSSRTSPEYTEYGLVEGEDYYYKPPTDEEKWTPVMRDSWFDGYSVWVGDNSLVTSAIEYYKGSKNVPDFYALGDTIKAVMNKIDPSITFEPDTTHSQFLFDTTNPVSNAAQGKLYITQKSNILNLGYDYPAWQAPITWQKIETLLNNAFECYWDLYTDGNGDKHLRIEHRTFYENGGTYSTPITDGTINLQAIYNTANRQPYSFKTKNWTWDTDGNGTVSTASRYDYGWMDNQSAIFDGETIEVPEEYRLFTEEKTEQRIVDWFSSDIDFLTAVPAECSSDGFCIVMENTSNNGWVISTTTNYAGQNYPLSFEYLQPTFLIVSLYPSVVSIGGVETTTNSAARLRTSEVEFRVPKGTEVRPTMIIQTDVGDGVVDSLEWDLSDEGWTATIRYENE